MCGAFVVVSSRADGDGYTSCDDACVGWVSWVTSGVYFFVFEGGFVVGFRVGDG